MIVDAAETVIVDHGGWDDDYRVLWRYLVASGEQERIFLTAGAFRLRNGSDGHHLRVEERVGDGHYRFTVRSIAAIEKVVASATYDPAGWTFAGDATAWANVPRYAVVRSDEEFGYALLYIAEGAAEPDPLGWYNAAAYDASWQGLLEPYEIPGSDLIIICVQRDSRPVLYDPARRQVVGHLELAGVGGNPIIHFRTMADEVWADDYDTLVRLRPRTWEVLDARRLQGTHPQRREFIGRFWFPPDERVCVVPRPFSGDVVFLDPSTFEVTDKVRTGRQPLDAVLLSDGTVLARDWQTRRLLTARRRR